MTLRSDQKDYHPRLQDAAFKIPLADTKKDVLGSLHKNGRGEFVVTDSPEVGHIKTASMEARHQAFADLKTALSADETVAKAEQKWAEAREKLAESDAVLAKRLKAGVTGKNRLANEAIAAKVELNAARKTALQGVEEQVTAYRRAHEELGNIRAKTLEGQGKGLRDYLKGTTRAERIVHGGKIRKIEALAQDIEWGVKSHSPSEVLLQQVSSGKTTLNGATNAASSGWIRRNPFKASAIGLGAVAGGALLYKAMQHEQPEVVPGGFAEAQLQRRAASAHAQGAQL